MMDPVTRSYIEGHMQDARYEEEDGDPVGHILSAMAHLIGYVEALEAKIDLIGGSNSENIS
jgi:hypothetical protein